jgi:hypothetical protein
MRTLTQSDFDELMKHTGIKTRLVAELKFVKSTEALANEWSDYELLSIQDRTGDKGVLLLQPYGDVFIISYELSRRIVDSKTGRGRAIICDFCFTWQPGSNAASITFTHAMTKHKIGFLCCGDLNCSQHVRSATKASIVSRTQLRENMTNDDRIERLKDRLQVKILQLGLEKVSV